MKILVVDDHPVFLAGISAVLKNEPNINIVGTAENGEIAIQKAKELQPDIVIMDISMPGIDGIEATKQILEQSEKIKVLALSIHTGKRFVKKMLNAGASGYVPKDVAADEIVTAIAQISKGNMYLSPTITSVALSASLEPMADFNANVLKTKLYRPPVMIDFVTRKNIIEKLEKNREKSLSLITAPAGYGKSVAVSEWLENTKALHVWISLDEELNQLRVFLQYMITAFENIFPGTFIQTSKLIRANELPPIQIIAFTLINELDLIKQDFILVLDDYHEISNESIHKLIAEILHYPLEHMHLSIITRRDPPLALQRLRMNGWLLDVRMKDLSFSELEIKELYFKLHNIELSDTITKSLIEKTEGWIVGLRLASMSYKNQKDVSKFLQNFKGDIQKVSQILLEEVLMSQQDEIIEILIKSSILNWFSSQLIDVLIANSAVKKQLSGKQFIQNIIKANLFIIPLDNQNKYFRYHHLFKDLINKQLEQKCSQNEINKLHELAAKWFEKNKLTDEAFDHLILAQDNNNAARVIRENVQLYESEKKWHVIQKMLDRLPDSIIHEQAELLLIQAQIYFYQLNMGLIPPLLDRIDSLKKAGANVQKLYGKVSLFKGFVTFYSGNGKESLENFNYAFKHLPEDDIGLIATAELYIALSNQMIGNYETSIKHSIKRLEKPAMLHPLVEIYVNWALIQPQIIYGDLDSASKYLIRQHTISKTSKLDYVISWCHYLDGLVRLLNGQIDEAIELLEFTSENKYLSYPRSAVDAMALLIYAYQFKGQTVKATETLQALNEFVAYLGPYYQPIADSVNSQFAIISGDTSKATKWLKTNQKPMGEVMIFWYEIPCITWCHVLITEGSETNLKEAQLQLQAYAQQNEEQNNSFQLIRIKVLQALAFEKQKETENALSKINEALLLAIPGNILFPFVEIGIPLEALLLAVELDTVKVFRDRIVDVLRANNEQINVNGLSTISLKEDRIGSRISKSISHRQKEIIQLVAEGFRNQEIANKLFISESTVKKHLYNIFQIYDVKNRISLTEKAKELGLLEK